MLVRVMLCPRAAPCTRAHVGLINRIPPYSALGYVLRHAQSHSSASPQIILGLYGPRLICGVFLWLTILIF